MRSNPHLVDMPFRPNKTANLDERNQSFGGYTPKFQMMSNLNAPPFRNEAMTFNRNNNLMGSRPANSPVRGLTTETPAIRSIHGSGPNSYRRQMASRTVSGGPGERSNHLRSPVSDPLFQHRINNGRYIPAQFLEASSLSKA